MWATTIPPKVKVFWWRLMHNIVLTSWNLKHNHILVNLSCSLCGCGEEIMTHTLFLFPFIKPIWRNSYMSLCVEAAKGKLIWDLVSWDRILRVLMYVSGRYGI